MVEMPPCGKENAGTTVAGPHTPTAPTRGWLPIGLLAGVRLIQGERGLCHRCQSRRSFGNHIPECWLGPLNGDDRGTRSGLHSGHRQIQQHKSCNTAHYGGLLFMYDA